MDFTKGALDIPAESFRKLLLRARKRGGLGPMTKGNSLFGPAHLDDLIADRRYYVLTKPNRDAFINLCVNAEVYTKQVLDCDSKATCFGADVARSADKYGWKYGLACANLFYFSKTLGDEANRSRFKGYHSAPIVAHREGMEIKLEVIQPPHVYDSGRTRGFKAQTIAEEVRKWVIAINLV
jgi:hypothetical protein